MSKLNLKFADFVENSFTHTDVRTPSSVILEGCEHDFHIERSEDGPAPKGPSPRINGNTRLKKKKSIENVEGVYSDASKFS